MESGRAILDLLNQSDMECNPILEVGQEPWMPSLDECLLMKLEARESKESGADNWNEETFGAGQVEDWDYSQVLPPRTVTEVPLPYALLPPPPPPPGLSVSNASPMKIELRPDGSIGTPMSTTSGSDAEASDSESQ